MNLFVRLVPTIAFVFLFFTASHAQNTTINTLVNPSTWNALFPNRAGTSTGHPQGYNQDFYSYDHFKQAVDEMANFKVTIRLKNGVWGQVITVRQKDNNITYNYQDADANWYSNPTPETIIEVDFKDFINRTSVVNNKRELGAFLANISKETTGGWQTPVGGGSGGDYAKWGLYFVHELGYTSANAPGAYSQPHADYPPNPSQGYYGRGPIQLSWNYNYGQFSKFIYNDKNVLLNDPNRLQNDGVLAFKSAIWFWMMPQCPKPSCHQVMHDLFTTQPGEYTATKMYLKGFAHTNNIINGGLECRSSSSNAYTQKVALRAALYKYYLTTLGLSPAQVNAEDTGDYTTSCYENASLAMEDYKRCEMTSLSVIDVNNTTLMMYPNPATNYLVIENEKQIKTVEIYNSLGQMVFSTPSNSNRIRLNIPTLLEGLYFVTVQMNDDTRFTKNVLLTPIRH